MPRQFWNWGRGCSGWRVPHNEVLSPRGLKLLLLDIENGILLEGPAVCAPPEGAGLKGGEGHTEAPILSQPIHPRGFSASAASLKTIVILCSASPPLGVRPAPRTKQTPAYTV